MLLLLRPQHHQPLGLGMCLLLLLKGMDGLTRYWARCATVAATASMIALRLMPDILHASLLCCAGGALLKADGTLWTLPPHPHQMLHQVLQRQQLLCPASVGAEVEQVLARRPSKAQPTQLATASLLSEVDLHHPGHHHHHRQQQQQHQQQQQ